jgi:hypothetical protein
MKKLLWKYTIIALLGTALAQNPSLSGEYKVTGSHPSGTPYAGKATIRQTGQVYVIGWTLSDGNSYKGTGVLQGTHFAVAWTPCGVSSYTLRGNTLEGIWAGCENTKTGKETLTKK